MKISLLPLLVICLGLAVGANEASADTYSRQETGYAATMQYGTVDTVRLVAIEGEKNMIGQGSGAVIGGVAAHAVTGEHGRAIATFVGSVVGAVVGGMAQEKFTQSQGMEITVVLDDGSEISVVQAVKDTNEFVPGQRVRITYANGRARVTPIDSRSYRN